MTTDRLDSPQIHSCAVLRSSLLGFADGTHRVLVIDGGLIAVPGLPHLGRMGMEQGHAYSCMAETMLLTLAGHLQDTSLGKDLNPETLRMLKTLADRHGRGERFFGPLAYCPEARPC